MPLLEFTVDGPPVSYQTRDRANLQLWKQAVRYEAAKNWNRLALTDRLKFTVINFYEGEKPPLDDDNMVKPIRDALSGLVYRDDSQISYSETIQISIDAPVKIRRASQVLLDAYTKGAAFLYIRLENAPDYIQLPR
jgi:crossover junction endodeoxyribonuclease RusA